MQGLEQMSPMERLSALMTQLRELHVQEMEWFRRAYACQDDIKALEPAIRAVLEEVVWLEHPTWHRDRPTPQARVQRIAADRWREINLVMLQQTRDAAVNPRTIDIE
jgi:hypothetical protein